MKGSVRPPSRENWEAVASASGRPDYALTGCLATMATNLGMALAIDKSRNRWLAAIVALQLLLGMALMQMAWADEAVTGYELEIGNLVSAQVQSRIGHEFVKYFNDYWTPPEGLGNINVVIQERASPIWGSMIWVKVNDIIVYRQIFSSRAKDMKDVGKSAVERTLTYILTTRLANETDLIDDKPFDSL